MALALAKQLPDDQQPDDVAFADKPPEERHRILKAALLAGIFFLWDAKRGKFISTKTGRVIRADTIRRWVIEAARKVEDRLAGEATSLNAGKIIDVEFQKVMQKEIAKAESAMTASAVGGLKQMQPAQWGRVAIQIRKQQSALVGFGTDIAQSQLSPKEIISRAELYARAIYATHINTMTDLKQTMGSKFAKRILHQGAMHCQDCPDLADKGWVPIEDLVPIGDTACMVNCRCAVEYSGEGQPSQDTMIGMPD